jgi:hypothetical protein
MLRFLVSTGGIGVLLDFGLVLARAAWVRNRAGLTDKNPPYSTNAITDAVWPELPITGDRLPDGVTEMVVKDDKGRAQLYYSQKVGHPSQRLGIIHGVYHLMSDLRDGHGIRECDLTDRRFRQLTAQPNPIELACDLFAGEVLVPFSVLDRLAPEELFPRDEYARRAFNDECDRLASQFAVPVGFIRWRLYDLIHIRKTHFCVEGGMGDGVRGGHSEAR